MELVSVEAAFYLTAGLMLLSGTVVQLCMEGSTPEFGTHTPPSPAVDTPKPAARE